MQRYRYKAESLQGESLEGTIDAENLLAAIGQLEGQGVQIIRIDAISKEEIERQDRRQAFEHRLSHAISRSQQWVPALSAMVSELPNPSVRRHANRIVAKLKEQPTFESLVNDRDTRSLLPILLRDSDPALSHVRVFDWLQGVSEQIELRVKRRRHFVYPVIIVVLSGLVAVFASTIVIPIFAEMYREFRLNLPYLTKQLVWISEQLTTHSLRTLLVVAILILAGCGFIVWWRRKALTNRCLGIVVAGTTSNLEAMSNLVGTLAELIHLGAPKDMALELAGRSSGHEYYARATRDLAQRFDDHDTEGMEVSTACRLPPLLLHAMFSPRQSTPNVPLLRELSSMYRERASLRLDWFTLLFPVAAMITLCILAGFVVIALFMPLFTMITSLA